MNCVLKYIEIEITYIYDLISAVIYSCDFISEKITKKNRAQLHLRRLLLNLRRTPNELLMKQSTILANCAGIPIAITDINVNLSEFDQSMCANHSFYICKKSFIRTNSKDISCSAFKI